MPTSSPLLVGSVFNIPSVSFPTLNICLSLSGYEKNVTEARDAILKIVGQFESQVHEEVHIDPGVHSMIIGKRGRSIRKIMDDYKAFREVRFSRRTDAPIKIKESTQFIGKLQSNE